VVNYLPKVKPVLPIVNLVIPTSTLNATDVLNYNYKLSILNVQSKSDIEVVFNGLSQQNFTYDLQNKELFFRPI